MIGLFEAEDVQVIDQYPDPGPGFIFKGADGEWGYMRIDRVRHEMCEMQEELLKVLMVKHAVLSEMIVDILKERA